MTKLIAIQDGSYLLNPTLISDIDVISKTHWEVMMASGGQYTVEGADLAKLKKALEVE